MHPEQAEFLAAINKAPEDEVLRKIYSDWLLEHDQPEEAERQRQIAPATRWLRGFARRWNFKEAAHPYGRGHWDSEKQEWIEDPDRGPNPKALEEMIAAAVNGEYITAMDRDLHSASELAPGDEAEFWKNVEIYTGKRFDQNHRDNFGWSCSC